MSSRGSMAGWIGFAGILMVIIGGLDFIEGLIALFKDDYYVVTPAGYLAINLTGWGWLMLIWGVLLFLQDSGCSAAKDGRAGSRSWSSRSTSSPSSGSSATASTRSGR